MTPDIHTNDELYIEVGNGHTLYVHDWGYKKAKKPIITLHGGPGGQSRDRHKEPFDPKTQRVIFFDQRGCGKSTPLGKWHHNTTQDLANDITKIADKLNISSFILSGGSWGSCLALYYALSVPTRVLGLVINGVFTASQAEIDWVDEGLFRTHFPDQWETYVTATPKEFQDQPSAYHYSRALGSDTKKAAESGQIYAALQSAVSTLDDRFAPPDPDRFDPTGTLLEMRYLAKRCFLPEGYILKHARTLRMPVHIIQGRYDFVCPPMTAYQLNKIIPRSQLHWVLAGHRSEHETVTAMRLCHQLLMG